MGVQCVFRYWIRAIEHVRRTPLGRESSYSSAMHSEAERVGVHVKRWEEVLYLGMIMSVQI